MHGVDYLLAKVLHGKYVKYQNIMECVSKPTDSSSRRGISRSFNFVKEGYGWRVGHGTQISF